MAGCEIITKDHVKAILDSFVRNSNHFGACLFALGCGTGGRITELIKVKRGDILKNNGDIKSIITLDKLKTSSEENVYRRIPWEKALNKFLAPWLDFQKYSLGFEFDNDYVFSRQPNKHITRQYAWELLTTGYKKAGIHEKYACHGMRKFYGWHIYDYYMQESGDQLRALKLTSLALGHSSIDTTLHYLNIQLDSLGKALNEIFDFL